jgi:hypothetical protein
MSESTGWSSGLKRFALSIAALTTFVAWHAYAAQLTGDATVSACVFGPNVGGTDVSSVCDGNRTEVAGTVVSAFAQGGNNTGNMSLSIDGAAYASYGRLGAIASIVWSATGQSPNGINNMNVTGGGGGQTSSSFIDSFILQGPVGEPVQLRIEDNTHYEYTAEPDLCHHYGLSSQRAISIRRPNCYSVIREPE